MQSQSLRAPLLLVVFLSVMLALLFAGVLRPTSSKAPTAKPAVALSQNPSAQEKVVADSISEQTKRRADRPYELIRQAAAPSQELVNFIVRAHKVDLATAQEIVAHAQLVATEERLPLSLILAVIARESSFNPVAVNNRDVGLMQVNLYWHSDRIEEVGGPEAMLVPNTNIRVGARILKEYIAASGNFYGALRRYNGLDKNNSYPEEVLSFMRTFQSVS